VKGFTETGRLGESQSTITNSSFTTESRTGLSGLTISWRKTLISLKTSPLHSNPGPWVKARDHLLYKRGMSRKYFAIDGK